MILTCPNCGEIITTKSHTTRRNNKTLETLTITFREPNDREFARHLRNVRQIEDQETEHYPNRLLDDL